MAAVMDKTLQEAATGAIVAYAVGDALGWPIEPRGNRVGGTRGLTPELAFQQWRRREGGRYAPHEEEMPAGTYSDDTQLTIAVARSLEHDDWWLHFTRVELPWWQQYELGGGGALRRAAQAWGRGKTPWTPDSGAKGYWTAGGNGAAMRVLPHAAHSHHFEDARRCVLADGAASHGDPIALVGAQLFAYALWLMLHRTAPLGWGELLDDAIDHVELWAQFEPDAVPDRWIEHLPDDYHERWHRTVEQTREQLVYARNQLAHGALNVDNRVLADLGCFSKTGGAGTTTAVSAIYIASRHASDPTQGLLRAAFAYGADTDTLAAMTGALLGSIYHDWLGVISQNVTDSQLLHRIFTDKQTSVHSDATPYSKSAQRYVESELAGSTPGSSLSLPFYGDVTVTAVRDLDNRTAQIRSWWLTTADGQTFRIKRVSRAKRKPWIALPPSDLPPRPSRERRPPLNGFVMQVADMRAARLFYEELLGLPVSNETDRTMTIRGWLVLEQAPKARREPKLDNQQHFAVTLYADDEEFQELRKRLDQQDVSYVLASQAPSILAMSDPEGFPIEIRKI